MRPTPRVIARSAPLVALGAVTWLVWGTAWPLGVPGEWEWNRVGPDPALVFGLLAVAIVTAVYVTAAALIGRRIGRAGPCERGAWLAGLTLAGAGWMWVASEAAPPPYGMARGAWVLFYRGPSGYYEEARTRAGDLPAYLQRYEERMAEGDVLHLGTHPPGLVIAFRALIDLCESSPNLTATINHLQPESVRDWFSQITVKSARQPHPLRPSDAAALWLAALLVHILAAAAVVPLFGWLRAEVGPERAWQVASLWPLVPALTLFLPKSDTFLPTLGLVFLWLLRNGWDRTDWKMLLAGGVWLSASMLVSLAMLPVVFWAAVWGVVRTISEPAATRGHLGRRLARAAAVVLLGLILGTVVASLWMRLDVLGVWRWNLHNHAGFYDVYPRTYWKWLLINPVELAIAAGAPLAIAATLGALALLRPAKPSSPGHRWPVLAATVLTLGVLWISGKNSGEAARLWLFAIPWLLFLAAHAEWTPATAARVTVGPFRGWPLVAWLQILWLQAAATAVLVTRVAGFHLPGV